MNLYEESGGDTSVCEFCEQPLEEAWVCLRCGCA